jgi:hypothetical protein
MQQQRLPAVAGGILPPGPARLIPNMRTTPFHNPPGRMPGSTAVRMTAATRT